MIGRRPMTEIATREAAAAAGKRDRERIVIEKRETAMIRNSVLEVARRGGRGTTTDAEEVVEEAITISSERDARNRAEETRESQEEVALRGESPVLRETGRTGRVGREKRRRR